MKIFIIDDHVILREGIKSLLDKRFPDVVVVEAGTFEDAGTVLETNADIRLILLDLHLPGINGLEALKKLRARYSELPVVVFTGMPTIDIDEIFEAGAMGLVPKTYEFDSMWEAILEVMAGRPYRPSIVDPTRAVSSAQSPRETLIYLKDKLKLTDNEITIFQMLVKGAAIKTIAAKLNLKEPTVKTYNSKIYASFGVRRRSELLREIYLAGLSIDLS